MAHSTYTTPHTTLNTHYSVTITHTRPITTPPLHHIPSYHTLLNPLIQTCTLFSLTSPTFFFSPCMDTLIHMHYPLISHAYTSFSLVAAQHSSHVHFIFSHITHTFTHMHTPTLYPHTPTPYPHTQHTPAPNARTFSLTVPSRTRLTFTAPGPRTHLTFTTTTRTSLNYFKPTNKPSFTHVLEFTLTIRFTHQDTHIHCTDLTNLININ